MVAMLVVMLALMMAATWEQMMVSAMADNLRCDEDAVSYSGHYFQLKEFMFRVTYLLSWFSCQF